MLMGLLYGGFAALVLAFLFWALMDSFDYTLQAIILGALVFLASWFVAHYAEKRGERQKDHRETMRAGGERKPTSETRWENRPQ